MLIFLHWHSRRRSAALSLAVGFTLGTLVGQAWADYSRDKPHPPEFKFIDTNESPVPMELLEMEPVLYGALGRTHSQVRSQLLDFDDPGTNELLQVFRHLLTDKNFGSQRSRRRFRYSLRALLENPYMAPYARQALRDLHVLKDTVGVRRVMERMSKSQENVIGYALELQVIAALKERLEHLGARIEMSQRLRGREPDAVILVDDEPWGAVEIKTKRGAETLVKGLDQAAKHYENLGLPGMVIVRPSRENLQLAVEEYAKSKPRAALQVWLFDPALETLEFLASTRPSIRVDESRHNGFSDHAKRVGQGRSFSDFFGLIGAIEEQRVRSLGHKGISPPGPQEDDKSGRIRFKNMHK